MAKYIDVEPLMNGGWQLQRYNSGNGYVNQEHASLKDIPPADVRPVVTCAECDWHVDCGYHFCNKWCQPCPDNADFYCAYGERPNCGAKMEGNE